MTATGESVTLTSRRVEALCDGVFAIAMTILVLNIGFLLLISLLPLSTALLGQYPLAHLALVIYGANLVAATLLLGLHWQYATSRDRLVRVPLPPTVIRIANRRILTSAAGYFSALLLSLVFPVGALILYLAIPLVNIFPGRIDRHFQTGLREANGEEELLFRSSDRLGPRSQP